MKVERYHHHPHHRPLYVTTLSRHLVSISVAGPNGMVVPLEDIRRQYVYRERTR